MMSILKLIKKDLILDYGIFLNPKAAMRSKSSKRKLLALPIALIIILFYTSVVMRFIFNNISDSFMIQFGNIILSMTFLAFFMMLLFFGIGPFISKIYFSNDVSIMQRLPIKMTDIFASKVISSVISLLPISILFLVPVFIKHAGATGQGFIYYLIAFIGLLSGSIIIYSILSLINSILMSYINRLPQTKSVMQFLGMFLVLVLSLGIQVYTRKIAQSFTSAEDFIQYFDNIAKSFTAMFPFIRLITGALTSKFIWTKAINTLALLVLAVATLMITSFLGSGFLIKGINANQISAKKKNASIKESGFKSESVAMALAKREVAEIFKIPVYAFNFLSTGVLIPLLLALPLFTDNNISSADFNKIGSVLKTFDINIINQLSVAAIIGLVISIFLSISGQSATTSITREGKRIWLMQSLPISAEDQIKGRIISSAIFGIISVLPTLILLIVLLKPSIFMIIGLVIGVAIGIFLTSVFGLWVGILYPKLSWDNPQEAIKQNMSVFLSMLGVWAYIGLLGYILFKQFGIGNININNISIVAVVFIVFHLIIAIYLYKKEPSILRNKMNTYNA